MIAASLLLSAATAVPPALRDVRAACEKAVAARKVPSIAIAVVKDGRIVWEEGFGLADVARAIPATPHTIYTLASTGKSITGTAVMQLAERGKVDLDAPVNRYLAPLQLKVYEGDADRVTARSLLTMSVGIPHMWWHSWTDDRASAPPPIDELIRRYGMVVFPPGSGFHYSNLSYGILGKVVENVSGMPLETYLQRNIFGPLAMRDSSLRLAGQNDAKPYDDEGNEQPYAYSEPEAGAGYRSSVHDLALYAIAHMNDKRFKQLHAAGATGYAFGWGRVRDESGARVDISNGGIVGATSMLLLLPQKRIAVICLTNVALSDRITDTIAQQAVAALVPGYASKFVVPSSRNSAPDGSWIGAWSGKIEGWNGALDATLVVGEDKRFTLSINGAVATELLDVMIEDDGYAQLRARANIQIPLTDLAGKPHKVLFRLHRDGERLFGSALVQNTGRTLAGLPVSVELVRRPPAASAAPGFD